MTNEQAVKELEAWVEALVEVVEKVDAFGTSEEGEAWLTEEHAGDLCQAVSGIEEGYQMIAKVARERRTDGGDE